MSAYSNWDLYNVLGEHVIEDLQQDAHLKASGSLEIKEWAEQIAVEADRMRDDKLPRIACSVFSLASEDDGTEAGNVIRVYAGTVQIVAARGQKATELQQIKRLTARVERRLSQAFLPSGAAPPSAECKQLQNVNADIEGGLAGTTRVGLTGTEIDLAPFVEQLRAIADVGIAIAISFTQPND